MIAPFAVVLRDRLVPRWVWTLRNRLWLRPSSRHLWRRRWADSAYVPPWAAFSVSDVVLQTMVADGWLPAGCRLLDIGCGDGTAARALAAAGFVVTAVDFAEPAIRRAEQIPTSAPVRFLVCDITVASPPPSYGAFVDVGCFHALDARRATAYARHVTAVLDPHARGLIVWPCRDAMSPNVDAARARAVRALGPFFEFLSVDELVVDRKVNTDSRRVRAIVIRVERR